MWAPLSYDLCSAGVLDAEFFSQQCTLFVEAIILRRKPYPGIDAVSGPGTCVHDAVMRQLKKYRLLPTSRTPASPWEEEFVAVEIW